MGSALALAREGLLLALWLAAPVLVAALLAGVVTGLIGAFTQIQDPAVGMLPRAAAVGAALVLFGPAIGRQLLAFTAQLWPLIAGIGVGSSP
jgi:flagellar biosynthesis protein FliQ